MANLAPYNTLPPRPEYIRKVLSALAKHPDSRPVDLEKRTGLTRTQVLCTLEKLIQDNKVEAASQSPRRYRVVV